MRVSLRSHDNRTEFSGDLDRNLMRFGLRSHEIWVEIMQDMSAISQDLD